MFQTFLAGFGGVGGACAVITLCLKVWPGALESLATGLYAHVNPERLPYNSVLSQHFAKTHQLGERTERFDERMDELCRDTIKNTLISLIYGDQSHDHSLRRWPFLLPREGREGGRHGRSDHDAGNDTAGRQSAAREHSDRVRGGCGQGRRRIGGLIWQASAL